MSVSCDRLITCPGASPPMAVRIGSNPEDPEEDGSKKRIQRALDAVVAMLPFDGHLQHESVLWLASCIYDSSQSYSVCSSKHECKLEVFMLLSVNGTYGL